MLPSVLLRCFLVLTLVFSSALRAEIELVSSYRYLQLALSNSTGIYAQTVEDNSPATGEFARGVEAETSGGRIAATQMSILDARSLGAFFESRTIPNGNLGARGVSVSRLVSVFRLSRPTRYLLWSRGTISTADGIVNSRAHTRVQLGLAVDGATTRRPGLPQQLRYVQSQLLPDTLENNQEYTGVLPAGTYALAAGTYNMSVEQGNVESSSCLLLEFELNELPPFAITQQPISQVTVEGGQATFTVIASGESLTYQWQREGIPILGATSRTFTVNPVQGSDVGVYQVVVSQGTNALTSDSVRLDIARAAPAIKKHPEHQYFMPGESVEFSVEAIGDFIQYQWSKNGQVIPGARAATYKVDGDDAEKPGSYSVSVSSPLGRIETQPALASRAGRLYNLSSRAYIPRGRSQTLISGFVISGEQPRVLLLRAVGPGLAGYGVTGVAADPKLTLYNSAGETLRINDDWEGGGGTNAGELASAMTQAGAFALQSNSRDSAMLVTLPPGAYTMHVEDQTGSGGIVLIELYDRSEHSGKQRILNLSTRAFAGTGESTLIQGITIRDGARRLLIRGIGPTLKSFGVGGEHPDPVLTLLDVAGKPLATNDDWHATGSVEALSRAMSDTGAFPLARDSKDAGLVTHLPEGTYTVQISSGSTVQNAVGEAIVEVYLY